MLKILVPVTAVALLSAAPVMAQPFKTVGPTPGEQNSMHTGTTASNGSSTIVTDKDGTHPEGYPGFAVVNSASGGAAAADHRHHHHHRHGASDYSGR